MTTTRRTPVFDALLRQVREIGGTKYVVLELDRDSVDKAGWLAKAGRDFFSVSESMKGAVAKAVIDAVRSQPVVDLTVIDRVAPEAIRKHIVRRFEGGGFDTRLAPLSPGWKAFKAKHGLDARVGIATRALLNAVKACRISLRRA